MAWPLLGACPPPRRPRTQSNSSPVHRSREDWDLEDWDLDSVPVTAADHGPEQYSILCPYTPAHQTALAFPDRTGLQTSLSLNKLRSTIKAQLQNTFMIYTCMSRSCPPKRMPHTYAFRYMAHVIYLDTYRGLPYIPKYTVNPRMLTLLPASLLLEKAFPESRCLCLRAGQTVPLPFKDQSLASTC